MAFTTRQAASEQKSAQEAAAKPSTQLFSDQRASTSVQLKQQELMQGAQAPAQLAGEEEELLQGKFVAQRVEDEELLQGKFVAQRMEEEEPLQGKFVAQRVEEEEPLQGKFATAQLAGMEEEEPIQGKFEPLQRAAEEEELLQGKFETTAPAQREQKPNNTGMPDNLKSGIENLSGYSMDDVKVHYNSDKPAQLNAHAYAQGTDIHVAPGQEQHLPHEAWHVVQQKQGRVQPTMQMKAGVPVNDDAGLENEADVMGAKALASAQLVPSTKKKLGIEGKTVQRAELWWQTNDAHTQVISGPLRGQPDGHYVKRAKAGNSDELHDTETDSWNRAKDVSASIRAANTELFPDTSLKMETDDGNRTYYRKPGAKNGTISVIVTHNKDGQSYVTTETDEKLLIVHNHSASANYSTISKALNQGKQPKYGDTAEAAVHYLSLTPQS